LHRSALPIVYIPLAIVFILLLQLFLKLLTVEKK